MPPAQHNSKQEGHDNALYIGTREMCAQRAVKRGLRGLSTLISEPRQEIGHSLMVPGINHRYFRRRHAILPGFSGQDQDLGFSSYKGGIVCRGSEISVGYVIRSQISPDNTKHRGCSTPVRSETNPWNPRYRAIVVQCTLNNRSR